MPSYLVLKAAGLRLDDIYRYTFKEWGKAQADQYIQGLFQHFSDIAEEKVISRPVPAEFGVDGYVSRYQKHFIYWKTLSGGQIGIVTILHERQHQIERFNDDFDLPDKD